TWRSLWVSIPATTRRSSPSAMVGMPPFLFIGLGVARTAGRVDRTGSRPVGAGASEVTFTRPVVPSGRARLTRSTDQIEDTPRVRPLRGSDRVSETLPASAAAMSRAHASATRRHERMNDIIPPSGVLQWVAHVRGRLPTCTPNQDADGTGCCRQRTGTAG